VRIAFASAVVATIVFARSTASLAHDPKSKGTGEQPLELRLVVKKDVYVLDLGGKTPEEFHEHVTKAEKTRGVMPTPPLVDLILEIRNKGSKKVTAYVDGPNAQLTLELKGPGALSAKIKQDGVSTTDAADTVTLAPGRSYSIPIKQLKVGTVLEPQYLYWTKPGEYTLSATLQLDDEKRSGDTVEFVKGPKLTSVPVKVKVEEKGKR
jgi:hypothetical protein